jgi:hypothetical protein
MQRLVVSLLSVFAFATLLVSASAQPVSIGTANFIEWDIPADAGQPPAALEVVPTLPAGNRNVYYVTDGSTQPPRLVRFTPGSPISTAPAGVRAWNYTLPTPSNAPTGGLKVRDGSVAFIRDMQAITRINAAGTRRRYLDGLPSRSDLAEDSDAVWTTGPGVGGGTLQRLVAGVSSGAVTRWAVGGGAGSVYLSGVAVGPGAPGQKIVYYSEPTSNMIGQLTPGTNNVRRWLLPPPVTQPRQLDLDASGKVWVVTGSGHLVRLDPATNMVTPYAIPTPGSNPMGVGPNGGLIGFTETNPNKVGMLIPDGAQVSVTPTNTTITPATGTVGAATATIVPVDRNAQPIMKTGPATTTGTAATGIFVEAQLPLVPPPASTTPLAIEDDTVQPTAPAGAFARAFFYSLGNPTTNRIGRVELVRPAPHPTTLDLNPPTFVNPVDTEHCVTATVRDQYGEPMQGVNVEFRVTGSVTTSGELNTDNDGEAEFCYDGPAFPGGDAIHAWADWNPENDMQDLTAVPSEPFDDATKTWIFPASTPGCEVKITNGGWIIAANTDRASFGGNAKVDADGNVSGQEEYQDHGPFQPMNAHGNVLIVTCSFVDRTQATIFGNATVDGAGSYLYRIDVKDLGEPGVGLDTYRFRLEPPSTYDSGEQLLQGGNVQIHKN